MISIFKFLYKVRIATKDQINRYLTLNGYTNVSEEVLNILKKHQVYLVEKTNLHSEAWRLDEMSGIRVDDNLYAKYYAGALGATPNI